MKKIQMYLIKSTYSFNTKKYFVCLFGNYLFINNFLELFLCKINVLSIYHMIHLFQIFILSGSKLKNSGSLSAEQIYGVYVSN